MKIGCTIASTPVRLHRTENISFKITHMCLVSNPLNEQYIEWGGGSSDKLAG